MPISCFFGLNAFAIFVEHFLALIFQGNANTITLKEPILQSDCNQLVEAMKEELEDHIHDKHWKAISIKSIPKNKQLLSVVWSMKEKRNPISETIKWKSQSYATGH